MLVLLVSLIALVVEGPINPESTIPLDSIWAWDMPGTKDVRELEPKREEYKKMVASERAQKSLALNTRWRLSLNFKPKGNKNAGSAFVVDAEGLEALKKANAILAKEEFPIGRFKPGTSLTLVFYAYGGPCFVRIGEVVKKNNEIIVKYHFHVHGQLVTTQHYALIPLGDDLSGRIKVTMERTEDTVEGPFAEVNSLRLRDIDARRLVSGSTYFHVLEPPE